MIAVHHFLNGDTLLFSTYSDRHSVLIGTSDEYDILLLESEIAHIDICWHIDTSEVTDVYTAVSVWQCCGNGCPFKLFIFHWIYIVFIYSLSDFYFLEEP